jgi:ubiquinone/menaquinone biosynthesis C-methylase UbiE
MPEVIRATPLYEFLRQCNESALPRTVLDCGAGGPHPPLALFHDYGYSTCGIEIQEEALWKAQQYCAEKKVLLNIFRGDMRAIPFGSQTFSFVYSYNAIFFMTKPDIERSVKEIIRVLKPGGLCYVNFKSVDDPDDRPFCESAFARHLLHSERFAKHADDEADACFGSLKIVRKEKRREDKVHGTGRLVQVYIEYIAQKALEGEV